MRQTVCWRFRRVTQTASGADKGLEKINVTYPCMLALPFARFSMKSLRTIPPRAAALPAHQAKESSCSSATRNLSERRPRNKESVKVPANLIWPNKHSCIFHSERARLTAAVVLTTCVGLPATTPGGQSSCVTFWQNLVVSPSSADSANSVQGSFSRVQKAKGISGRKRKVSRESHGPLVSVLSPEQVTTGVFLFLGTGRLLQK